MDWVWIATEPTASSANTLVQWFINQLCNYPNMTDNIVWLIPVRGDHQEQAFSEERNIFWLLFLKKLSHLLAFVQVAGYNTMSLSGRYVSKAYSEISYLHSNSMHLFFCRYFVSSRQNFVFDLPV